jgi:hypothetical protein
VYRLCGARTLMVWVRGRGRRVWDGKWDQESIETTPHLSMTTGHVWVRGRGRRVWDGKRDQESIETTPHLSMTTGHA